MTDNSSPSSSYQPGHYYSPIPSNYDILERSERHSENADGIDLNEKYQLELLNKMKWYYEDFPYTDGSVDNLRYDPENVYYYDSDAIFLYGVMRHFEPSNIIEVGSGFSSSLMMDTNEMFLGSKADLTFIDPDAKRLMSILRNEDTIDNDIITKCVQDVDISAFQKLRENDILFIDSSHVIKTGSDVNFILFEILPSLRKGVLIHFHDIFYPFVYPRKWLLNGRFWNEAFGLRTFLQYNSAFEIILFNTFLQKYHEDWFASNMPLCLRHRNRTFAQSGSIWLRKIQ